MIKFDKKSSIDLRIKDKIEFQSFYEMNFNLETGQ